MRRANSIYKEIQRGGEVTEDLQLRPRTFLDTSNLVAQAQLVGILKALAWVTGDLKESPVDDLLKTMRQKNDARRSQA